MPSLLCTYQLLRVRQLTFVILTLPNFTPAVHAAGILLLAPSNDTRTPTIAHLKGHGLEGPVRHMRAIFATIIAAATVSAGHFFALGPVGIYMPSLKRAKTASSWLI